MFEDGVCEVEEGLYSRSFKFSDINYKDSRNDEQIDFFSQYCELLNYCDPSMHFQISIVNRRIDEEDFKKNMFMPMADDSLNNYRKEMNNMLAEKALEGQNSIIRERFFTFATHAHSYKAAVPLLARLQADLSGHFQGMGCDINELDGQQRTKELHQVFRPEERFTFEYKQLIENNLTTKAMIAPMSFDFKEKNTFEFGDYVGQVLFVKELPSELSDKVIQEIADLPIDMIITMHIDNVDQVTALEFVKRQIAYMEMEATGRQDQAVQKGRNTSIAIPIETRRSYEEAGKLLDDLENKNQRMFKMTTLIYTYAKDYETLQDNAFQITATARKNNVKVDKLDLLQREGINTVLPLGKNHIEIKRTLTTAQTAIFIPFSTQELYQPGGMYYGLNAHSRKLTIFDRKSLAAPNGFILGKPGSGKSFASKREIINVLLNDPNSEVIIIDPEREYTPLAQGFDGEVVHISAASKSFINPLDINLDYSDDDDPTLLKSEFILSLCDLLIGGRDGLDGTQRSIIDRVCTMIYRPYLDNIETASMPTLKTFFAVLKKQPEPEAQSLALALELYIEGNLSVFANETNINTEKRLVIYDIKDLGKQLRTMGMLIVLDQIWNRVTQNRALGKRTWIPIDEIQLLFSNEYSANYFFELWSRSRKWGAIPTGITQNVETLLLSDLARRMLSNSDFIMLFNQSASDRDELANLLKVSSKQLNHITNSKPGTGLLIAGGSAIPFVDEFPKDTRLYKMMTTKIEEITAMEETKTWSV